MWDQHIYTDYAYLAENNYTTHENILTTGNSKNNKISGKITQNVTCLLLKHKNY